MSIPYYKRCIFVFAFAAIELARNHDDGVLTVQSFQQHLGHMRSKLKANRQPTRPLDDEDALVDDKVANQAHAEEKNRTAGLQWW